MSKRRKAPTPERPLTEDARAVITPLVQEHCESMAEMHFSIKARHSTCLGWDAAYVGHARALYATLRAAGVEMFAYPLNNAEAVYGLQAILFDFAPTVAVLRVAPGGDGLQRLALWQLPFLDDPRPWITLEACLHSLAQESEHPVCLAFTEWVARKVIPEMLKTGWYAPRRNHKASSGQELRALEIWEEAKDRVQALFHGEGDGN
jgi:hypothetical protein